MGGTTSSNQAQPGGLLVNVDKASYKPGDVVQGNIFLNLTQSVSATSLDLNLRIEEFTEYIVYTKNKKYSNSHPCLRVLYDSTASLLKFNQNLIPPGQYQFPFSFGLPLNMPGSFEYYDKFTKSYIKYTLEAKLSNFNSKSEIKNQVLLIVNQPFNIESNNIFKEVSQDLTSFFCIHKGCSTLKVFIPREYFYSNDTIIAKCELDNKNTSLSANNVKVTLKQNIALKDGHGKLRRITRQISSINYRHIYPKKNITKFTTEMPNFDYGNPTVDYVDMCDHLHLLKYKQILSSMQASVKSDNIQCYYTLKFAVDYNSYFITSKSPTIEIPLTVYIPDIRINVEQFMPNKWHPMVYPIFPLRL